MDPVLTSIVAAMTAGAVASAKDVASSAIKDAYAAVKSAFAHRYQSIDVEKLKQDVIENAGAGEASLEAKKSGLLQDEQIHQLVEQLKVALKQDDRVLQTIGVTLRDMKIGKVSIADIVGFDMGVVIENSSAEELNIGGVVSTAASKKKTLSPR